MFSGIIDHCGRVLSVEDKGSNKRIRISCQFQDIVEGESIAVDGICLTALEPQKNLFSADVSPETLSLTTAANYLAQTQVNLERSLRLNDRLSGHFVTGHVDHMCQVAAIETCDKFLAINFHKIGANQGFLVKKGSVALNGVSLTINDVFNDGFQVMLIPHTLEITNLSSLKLDQWVNIEYDYLAKLVANQRRNPL